MTDISVFSQSFQSADLSWDLTPDMTMAYVEGGTIAVAAFTQAQHYPNGYIPAGTVVALGTASTYSGFLVPYLAAGSNGAATPVGILRADITVVQLNGALKTNVGAPVLKAFGVVSVSHLPFTSGNAAAGGYIDTAAQTALRNLFFAA